LELIRNRGLEPTIVEYLKIPPSRTALTEALRMLGLEPRKLMRTKETVYQQLSLGDEGLSDEELVAAMVEHPVLIERPIVFLGKRALLCRPPERVLELFD